MAFSVDYSTTVGQVRAIIHDIDQTKPLLQDEDIAPFLTINNDEPLLAAAMVLDTIATNQTLVLKVMETLDLRLDGAKMADSLRKHAKALREQYEAASESTFAGFDIAHPVYTSFAWDDRILRDLLKEA